MLQPLPAEVLETGSCYVVQSWSQIQAVFWPQLPEVENGLSVTANTLKERSDGDFHTVFMLRQLRKEDTHVSYNRVIVG